MALVLKRAMNWYRYLMVDLADERTQDFPMIRSPIPIIVILTLYFMFIFKWGPTWMKHRKPYDLKKILIVYNIIQMISCTLIVLSVVKDIRFDLWYCYPIPPAHLDSPAIKYMGYYYFLLKICDLLDTVFFILKKNYRQVTVLHVFHHALMVFVVWIGNKYLPGGHSCFLPFINSIVHIIMYGYYLLTAYDGKYKYSIAWKKQITHIQLLQFGILIVMHIVPLINNCNYSKVICFLELILNGAMITLFSNFYYHTYIKAKNKSS